MVKNLPKKTNFISEKIENQFVQNFIDNISKFLNQKVFPDTNTKFILGVSGGIDSMVMLDAFYLLSKKFGFKVYVAHFNHKLRGEDSEKDSQFVQSVSSKYKLEFYSGTGNVKSFAEKNNLSIELSSRTLRYNFFERTSRNLDADFVVTAHHKNDLAETFLINLFRGSGLTGLSGIPSVRKFVKNVRIIRPLLNFSKSDFQEYAKLRNIKWREDKTNSLSMYTRNRIRNELLPLITERFSDSVIDTINRAAQHINGADEFISDFVNNNMTKVIDEVEPEKVSVNINILSTYQNFIKGEILQAILVKYFRIKNINLNTVDRIINLTNSLSGAFIELPENIIATKDRDNIVFNKKIHHLSYKEKIIYPGEYKIGKMKLILKVVTKRQIKYTKDPKIEYFDLNNLPPFLEVRSWEYGDVFNPLGMDGNMSVSDFMTNIKLPAYEKPNILVLTNQVDIMWICGYRISDKFKVNSETKRALKAQLVY